MNRKSSKELIQAKAREMGFDLVGITSSEPHQDMAFFGVRYEDEILYNDEWLDFAERHPKFHYIPTISRPKEWRGEVGYVQRKLQKYITSHDNRRVYVCGLVPMIEAVEKAAIEIGFDLKQIHFEKYV